ncbi:recQ-mediated genome instability protein 1-like [Sorghum bicolor]|uniref:recQ-mediated genome instability protein 1-like n=1 Tax=Sorghum bicolor TaxID=4558 RepID=UPI000B426613|nr:recQ-mediated genome instability protein 1-like [Sorghum bicolor]|eukprot:XP_021321779.1 recQ-mediated genome instability protein 1-like [Sorghum bicolor]
MRSTCPNADTDAEDGRAASGTLASHRYKNRAATACSTPSLAAALPFLLCSQAAPPPYQPRPRRLDVAHGPCRRPCEAPSLPARPPVPVSEPRLDDGQELRALAAPSPDRTPTTTAGRADATAPPSPLGAPRRRAPPCRASSASSPR